MAKMKKSESELQASEVKITPDDESVDFGEPVFKIEKQDHEETHGDKWSALGFSEEDEIMGLIALCVKEGSIPEGDAFDETKEYLAPIIHPIGAPVKICTLLRKRRKNYEVESAYPVFEGLLNEVIR